MPITLLPRSLPPGQQLAAPGKWPLVGERSPRATTAPWTLTIDGAVARPRIWQLAELAALPQTDLTCDIHCVTRWSKLAMTFRGVPLAHLLAEVEPLPNAQYISFIARSDRNHSTSLALDDALKLGTFIAFTANGEPLSSEHGGPVRTIVPGRYFYKSLKWLERIELLPADRLGYWEAETGYHNNADPWREERYLAPALSRQEMVAILATKNFAGRDLRSLAASGHLLRDLNAAGALLRDARFENADLRNANFAVANLSNAHFSGANLAGSSFANADCEGADFSAADLPHCDFRGASLFGASFCDTAGDHGAIIDSTTLIDEAALLQLTPVQESYVRRHVSPKGESPKGEREA
jgi:DMSO/TMAO reductase YedYZ molybdopterin-dependent catalytic subunit